MPWSCSIRMVDGDGDGVSGAKVTLMGTLFGGYMTEYTGSDGWAEFEIEPKDGGSWILDNIYINGDEVSGSTSISDGETLSFTI